MKQLASSNGHRALQLFLGLQDKQIMAALVPYGFNKKVMSDGLVLLRKALHLRISRKSGSLVEPVLLQKLDEFEGTWYPITRSTLARAFPAIAEAFFLNIGQQSRSRATLSVMAFLDRLADLAKADGPFGPDGPAARALLAERGLTAEVEAEANATVDALTDAQGVVEETLTPEQQDVAERELRLWYLEWSAIARVAIKDKRQRRRLGFLKRRAGGGEEEEVEAPVAAALPAVSGSTGPGIATPQLPPMSMAAAALPAADAAQGTPVAASGMK